MTDSMIEFRDFRGQAEADDFKFTISSKEIDEMIAAGDPQFREFRLAVGSGYIRFTYIQESARKILGQYYGSGASNGYSLKEYLEMIRGF